MSNEIPDIFNQLFSGFKTYSESDVISDYIDGKISKEEYIRRMDNARNKQSS